MTTVCVCLLLGDPEVHILAKVLKWNIRQFGKIFIGNTEQVVIHECGGEGRAAQRRMVREKMSSWKRL